MAVANQELAHIVCACGEEFQILNEAQDDWDRHATEADFEIHLPYCPATPDPEP